MNTRYGRSDRVRTCGLMVPNHPRCQLRHTPIIKGTRETCLGGNNRARTYDPLLVRQMLSQLSYAPENEKSITYLNAYVKHFFYFAILPIRGSSLARPFIEFISP